MKIFITRLFILFIIFPAALHSQVEDRHITDSVTRLIQKHYNSKDIPALYSLCGENFLSSVSEKKLEEVVFSLHSQMGPLVSWALVSWDGNLAKYKLSFNVLMAMQVSLDKTRKLEIFSIQSWEKDTARKLGPVLTDNPRKSLLDKKVDSFLFPYMSKPGTVGLVLGVLKKNVTHVYGYGETRKGSKIIPNGNTLFEIGSISKTFTATLLSDLVLKRKIGLDDPINKYLPDSIPALQFNGVPINIKNLSNHSSGLPRMPMNLFLTSDPANPYKHYNEAMLFYFLKRFKPIREPGKEYEYSNLAVGLLGVILERVSGMPYESLLQQTICKPLALKNTRVSFSKTDSANAASGHNENGQLVSSWEFMSLVAAGGMRSSVDDLLLYAKEQGTEGHSTIQKAINVTHQQTFQHGENRVGLGWHIVADNGNKYLAHTGQTGGYWCMMLINQSTGNSIVVLTNSTLEIAQIPFLLIRWLDQN